MKKFNNIFLNIFSGVSLQEKINFARHLSVAIKSGLPLLTALKLIRRQVASKHFGKVINEVISEVEAGRSLAQSLSGFPHIFNEFFVSLVKVGETSGNLSENLLHLASELKKQREVNRKIRSALVYPIVILIVTIAVTLFLTLFIFPKILPIFISLGIQLPLTTRIVIAVLTFLGKSWLWILGGLVLFMVGIRLLLKVERVHFYFDKLLLNTPFLSKIIVNLTMTNFSRSLSVLLKSGMTIIDALYISKGTFHNKYYRAQIERIAESVKKGESIAAYLAEEPKLFPPMVHGMVEVGETTGNLEQNLLYLSEHYESEVDEVIKNLTTLLEPFLLVLMGLLVGFVALAIITPIYQVTQGLRFR